MLHVTLVNNMENKEIEQVKQEIKVLQSKLALLEEMEKYKSPAEEAYKEWMGKYPPTDESVDNTDDIRWRAFQMGWLKAQQTYKVGTYQPAPQTPEQVEESLKQAFREAQKLKEWEEKQKKIDNPKQEPDMLLMRQGKVDVVDYNKKIYYRIEYTDSFSGVYKWFEREKTFSNLMPIGDRDISYNLENYYLQQVIKQKEEYPYKKYTPEETSESLKQAFREAKKSKEWKETQKKIDTPIRREEFGDKLIEKLMANPPDFLTFQLSQTLEDLITDWWSDIFTSQSGLDMEGCIHNLCERIENWLPDESSSAGSQDNYAIVAVDAENQLLQKIKSKIYSKENTL